LQGESVETEALLLSAKAHASPMVKDGTEVVLVFDEESKEAADSRRLHIDGAEHTAAARKGHTLGAESSRFWACAAVILAFWFLFAVVYMLPPLPTVEDGRKFVWRPRSAGDFELDRRVLARYRDEHAWQLLLGMAVVYIILQTFCVPASGTSMNVLAGCIFSETLPSGEYLIALPMAVLCVSFGAVICYLISYISLRELITVCSPAPAAVRWRCVFLLASAAAPDGDTRLLARAAATTAAGQSLNKFEDSGAQGRHVQTRDNIALMRASAGYSGNFRPRYSGSS
jgi:hypothetical protein